MPDRLTAGRFAKVSMSFFNPLDVPLTRCSVNLECSGTIWPTKEKVQNIPPKSSFYNDVTVKPRKTGSKTCVGVFSAEEMIDVNGSVKVEVYNYYCI